MSTYQPGDYEATRRRLTDALHTASLTVRNAQEVRDQAEEALDAFLDEHGTSAPMRIQVYAWPDGVSLEDVGDRAVDEETGGPVVTVPDETGKRWLAAQQAWEDAQHEATAAAYPHLKKPGDEA
jgi:hypothetical protein